MNRQAYTRGHGHYRYEEPRMEYLNDPIMHANEPIVEYIPRDHHHSRYQEPREYYSSRPHYDYNDNSHGYDRHRNGHQYLDDFAIEPYREPVIREYKVPRHHEHRHKHTTPYVTEYLDDMAIPSRYDTREYSSRRANRYGGGEIVLSSRGDRYDRGGDRYNRGGDRYDNWGWSRGNKHDRYDDYNGGYRMRRHRSDPSLYGY